MWSFVTPPGPERNAAGKPTSSRELVVVYAVLAILLALPVVYLVARDEIREATNHEDVQTRDRWIEETDDLVMVTRSWTGRARVSLGFDSCEDEIVVKVGFDDAGTPVIGDGGLGSDSPWVPLDDVAARRLETRVCGGESLRVIDRS